MAAEAVAVAEADRTVHHRREVAVRTAHPHHQEEVRTARLHHRGAAHTALHRRGVAHTAHPHHREVARTAHLQEAARMVRLPPQEVIREAVRHQGEVHTVVHQHAVVRMMCMEVQDRQSEEPAQTESVVAAHIAAHAIMVTMLPKVLVGARELVLLTVR